MPTQMPTAAKAVSAFSFAVLGWIAADVYVPRMPTAQSVGYLRELTAVIGIVIGWSVMGKSVGRGYLKAIGSGWKTTIILVFMALLVFGTYEMLINAFRQYYEGAFEATLDIFMTMAERTPPLLNPTVLMVLVIGGGIAGLLAENTNRRWP
jgi:hypothetical protein